MKKIEYSYQCILKKLNTTTTSFIHEKYLKKGLGTIIKLKNENRWSDGWEVIHIGIKKPYKDVIISAINYRNQRKSSDI